MSTTIEKPKPLAKKLKLNTYPFYSPRFWHGMCLGDWFAAACGVGIFGFIRCGCAWRF